MPKKKSSSNTAKKQLIVALIIVLLAIVYSLIRIDNYKKGKIQNNNQQVNQVNRQNCLADECLAVNDLTYPAGELPQEVQEALDSALDDEYKALSTYEAVISEYGSVRPFAMIKGAEEQHIASLKAIYDKYGLTAPANNWTGKVNIPSSLPEACQIGVEAEIDNAALYREQLLPVVIDYEDISLVFTSLMNASQQKHLPAFEKCN